MKRKVLAIPRTEIETQFALNSRQELKVVAPEIMTDLLFQRLRDAGREVKTERPLDGATWRHSAPGEANHLCESSDFMDEQLAQCGSGPFAISFANEKAHQDEHYHERHLEIYVTDHPISAEFRLVDEGQCDTITLASGGILVFAPNVIHRVSLSGMTVIIELPAVAQDKKIAKLHDEA